MSSRLPLHEIERIVRRNLSAEWRTPTDYYDALRRKGHRLGLCGWERVALVLERLANDGVAELERPGSTRRRFRRAA